MFCTCRKKKTEKSRASSPPPKTSWSSPGLDRARSTRSPSASSRTTPEDPRRPKESPPVSPDFYREKSLFPVYNMKSGSKNVRAAGKRQLEFASSLNLARCSRRRLVGLFIGTQITLEGDSAIRVRLSLTKPDVSVVFGGAGRLTGQKTPAVHLERQFSTPSSQKYIFFPFGDSGRQETLLFLYIIINLCLLCRVLWTKITLERRDSSQINLCFASSF